MSPRGTISSKKIMFAHIALLGFQRAGGQPAVFVTSITLHRLSAFASGFGDFFHGTATPKASHEAHGFHNELILFHFREIFHEFI